jgi:hypothetical protein
MQIGEMAEWFKAHAWKACLPKGNVGSNPSLSATFYKGITAKIIASVTVLELPHLQRILTTNSTVFKTVNQRFFLRLGPVVSTCPAKAS